MKGAIRNIERKQQINNFSDLLFGNITPTDLDGIIEYKNKAYIFFELKYLSAELPFGQKLCLERLVKDTTQAGKSSIALILEHNIHDVQQAVIVAECKVREYFFNRNEWIKPKREYLAIDIISQFLANVDSSK